MSRRQATSKNVGAKSRERGMSCYCRDLKTGRVVASQTLFSVCGINLRAARNGVANVQIFVARLSVT